VLPPTVSKHSEIRFARAAGCLWSTLPADVVGNSMGEASITHYKRRGTPAGLLRGQYCAALQYGVVSIGPLVYSAASIAQSGQVPLDARSIQFRGTFPFTVTFAGNAIPLVVLSSQADYSLYGGDISQFAGQTGDLTFTSNTHFGFLDGIQFSPEPVPEPSSAFLFITAGILFGLRSRKCGS
jgi:hypothetical protein